MRVRVQPRSSRDAITQSPDGRFRVALTAAPVDDAANLALCALVARALDVAKSAVSVVHGGKSREKTLRIRGREVQFVEQALAAQPDRR